jgi:hypothetical protein
MAKFYTRLNGDLREFIQRQKMFFTASAPSSGGRVNLSPKGLDTFRVLSDTQVGYLDLTGSGIETAAHVAENGRLTFLFCSFDDKPLILRLYGRGRVVRPRDGEWGELRRHFRSYEGERLIILLDIESAQTSCGYGVPEFEFKRERTLLPEYACKLGPAKLADAQRQKNQRSIDGLPSYLFEEGMG